MRTHVSPNLDVSSICSQLQTKKPEAVIAAIATIKTLCRTGLTPFVGGTYNDHYRAALLDKHRAAQLNKPRQALIKALIDALDTTYSKDAKSGLDHIETLRDIFADFGSHAVPALVRAASSRNSLVAESALNALGRTLEDPRNVKLAPDIHTKAIPRLVRLQAKPGLQQHVAHVLECLSVENGAA